MITSSLNETVPLRFVDGASIVPRIEDLTSREPAAMGLKHALFAASAGTLIACLPVVPAAAGPIHPWGLGHGLLGAVFGLATLPLAIVSAAVSAGQPAAPAPAYPTAPEYSPGYAPGYAPSYAPSYAPGFAPRPSYYPSAGYYAAPPAYFVPRPYFQPHPSYRGGYGARDSYRSGGYGYRRR
jgi:hypothetical protein